MPTRQIKISFFQVVVTNPEAPVSFHQILTTLNAVPNDQRRTMFAADEPVRLRYLRPTANRWLGDIAKIRLHEEIEKSTTDGQEARIAFQENEGPLEKTAFLYDPLTKIMAIQQTLGAVSPSSCGRYFKTLGAVKGIELRPVMKLEALERILRMGTVEKFQIRFAGIDSGRPLRGGHAGAREMIQSLRLLRGPKASISVAVDRETPTLARVGQFIADALEWNRTGLLRVEKVLVVGSEGEEQELTAIDLLTDRAVETIPVELLDGRRLNDHDRYQAITTAWNRQQDDLQTRFGNEEG